MGCCDLAERDLGLSFRGDLSGAVRHWSGQSRCANIIPRMGRLVHSIKPTGVRDAVGVPLDDPQELSVDAPRLVKDLYVPGRPTESSALDLQALVLLADQRVVDLRQRLGVEVSSSVSHSLKALRDAGLITEQPAAGHHRRRSRPLTPAEQAQAAALAALAARARDLLDQHLAKPQG